MALTLADCDAIIAAVERHKVHLVVGHTHAFDPAVRLMRDIIARGELGRLGMIHSFNYTNFLYRPRRPEELDTAQGGGILFNQVPHQIDTARLLAGGAGAQRARAGQRARSGAADRGKLRGAAAIRRRRRGLAGLQRLRSFRFRRMAFRHRRARRAEADRRTAPRAARWPQAKDETRLRTETFAYGSAAGALPPHQPHFGITIVTCAERRHARLGRRRHDLRPRRHARNPDPARRGHARPARGAGRHARGDPLRPPAAARRPLGQGHRRGCARDPALGARGPGGRAGASGGGGRFAGG